MMNKNVFRQYITNSDFRNLFTQEMGWNNPRGQVDFEFTIDDEVYEFTQIADRNGFQAITCAVNTIPTSSVCKKIDTKLRRVANDYVCVYYIPNTEHHLWVVPVKKVEKRDLVLVEYDSVSKADFLFEKVEKISFGIDEYPTIMDVKDRVNEAFIVNSEKITKDFYAGFRKEHTNFAKYITGIDDEITDLKKNRNKQWYTSVMLNRLMFCYFIQKKGFLDLNKDYLRDKLAWVKNEKGENRFYDSFYRGFLVSLFHDGLNSPRHQEDFVQKYGRIPYLNGGMFGIHELEENYPELDVADEAFESLFAFFDQWHWHLDDRLTASGKDINPDVLGYIFEQYINDRAQMGAYYTKEDITEYIGRNTILPYLMDATKKVDDKPFKTNGEVWLYLRESGDKYIFDAVKKGCNEEIPEEIAVGIDTTAPNLLERRSHWNERTPEAFALPTEIWRETIERLQRYKSIKNKIENGEITEINDFITYNLDIRQFVQDLLAQTDDHLLVKHFYAQLQKVTILDPTCGSGAFLFAALNILEPLYEVCIERMQSWNDENPNLFKEELEELNGRYNSNIRYFIYKSIILRNLYGVDIMVEATEIAKLRLFLKMVAVVDVNRRDKNLGLDPLPDIDFNIRCGNTLVGYATEADMLEDLDYGDVFAKQEFKDKVAIEMDVVAKAYSLFKKVQLEQETDLEVFRKAKMELKSRLKKLNDVLNHKQYSSVCSSHYLKYNEWLKSHQPFNWLAEYYDIVNGNRGFDIIIGNPPYVEYSKVKDVYKVNNYRTESCGNLYAFVIEKALRITRDDSYVSMIVPLSLLSTPRMKNVKELIKEYGFYGSFYAGDSNPSTLFSGVKSQLSIIVLSKTIKKSFSTNYVRWFEYYRNVLFKNITYTESFEGQEYYKIGHDVEASILHKLQSDKKSLQCYFVTHSSHKFFYRNASGSYYRMFYITPPRIIINGENQMSTTLKLIHSSIDENIISSICSSSLFHWYWTTISDNYHITQKEFVNFYFNYVQGDKNNDALISLNKQLMADYKNNSTFREETQSATNQLRKVEIYYPRMSKPIIDKIDVVLSKHYGFTEEELDFIINYDIKYRMGDE